MTTLFKTHPILAVRPLITILVCLTFSISTFAGSYTWKGNGSAWATDTNWTPTAAVGGPGANDTVLIVNGTNAATLSGSVTVKKFTISSGTLDCGSSYTLTVTSTGTFSGGSINNGTLTCYGTSTLTFSGTTFGVVVNATGNSLILNGSLFSNTFYGCKKGSANDNGNGSNIFQGAVTLIDSGTGNLVLSNNSASPDTFNSSLSVAARSSGSIYLAHQGTGNVFSGKVSMYSSSSGRVYSNYYGTAAYNDSVFVSSTSSGGEYFGMGTGSCTLASGKTISVGTEGFSHTATSGNYGTLYLHNFIQNGTSPINLTLSGTRATMKFESGTVINGNVTVSAPGIFLDGSRFLGKANLTYSNSGAYTINSVGGNYFGDSTTIINNNSATTNQAGTAVDTFATYCVLENLATSYSINNALFLGNVKFKNSLGSQTEHYWVASTGNVTIKGNATIENANSTITFGSSGGTTVLDTNCRITIPSGSGIVRLTNVVQYGSDTINIPMSASTDVLYLKTGNVLNGPFIFNGNRILLNGTTFNGTVDIKRTSATTDACDGGNVFNSTTVICDSVSTSNSNRSFQLATVSADDFNGNVTFKQHGSGTAGSTVRLYPAYSKNSTFAGNVTVEGNNAAIEFGTSGGKVIFDGSSTQTISKTGTYAATFKRIQVNKTDGTVTLAYPITLMDTLFLTKGVIATDTTNLLTVPNDGKISGGSDSSYIRGPLKKVGDDEFIFTLGDANKYHPLVFITAPSSSSDAFTAAYFNSNSGISDTLDSVYSNTCEYWTLKHDIGSSSVKVGLGWYVDSCSVSDTTNITVVGYNGTTWTNYGIANLQNNINGKGIINSSSLATIATTGKFTFTIATYKPVLDFIINTDTANGGDLITFINNSKHFNPNSKFVLSFGDTCSWCNDTLEGDFLTWHIYTKANTYNPSLKLTDLYNVSYSSPGKTILINPHTLNHTPLTDFPRGMYVNNFIKFFGEVSVDHLEVDPNLTILGNSQKEDELLDYCRRNNFTYIVLYDLYPLINFIGDIDPRTGLTFGEELCNFITKAKENYCIEKIGAAGSSITSFTDIVTNYQTPAIQFTSSERNSLGPYNPLLIAENVYTQSHPLFKLSELIKYIIRLANYNTANATNAGVEFSSVGGGLCSNGAKIDVITLESEFWRIVEEGNYSLPSDKWPLIVMPLISAMDNLKTDQFNNFNNVIFTEIYLGYLESVESASGEPCVASSASNYVPCCDASGILSNNMADFIDPLMDRVFLSYYDSEADRIYDAALRVPPPSTPYFHNALYEYRFLSFEQNNTTTSAQPLFDSECEDQGGQSNYFGLWFAKSLNNNVFTAEKLWYDDWHADNTTVNLANSIAPGSSHWYSSESLLALADYQKIFRSNSPVCEGTTVSFTYQGPISQGLKYDFWITNDIGNTILFSQYNQSWPAYYYTGANHSGSSISLQSQNLVSGNYHAHLKLYYDNSLSNCTYQYDLPVAVTAANAQPNIQAFPSSICQGIGQAILHAPSGSNYNWELNYGSGWQLAPSNGAINQNPNQQDYVLYAVNDGIWSQHSSFDFRCRLTTPCCTNCTSNVVTITINPNLIPSISGLCGNTSEGCTLQVNSVPSSVTQITWSDGTHGNSLFVNSSGSYSVRYDNTGGCSWTAPIHVTKPEFSVESPYSNALCPGGTNTTTLHISNFRSFTSMEVYQVGNAIPVWSRVRQSGDPNDFDIPNQGVGTYYAVGHGTYDYSDQLYTYCFTSSPIVVDIITNFSIDDVTVCNNEWTVMKCNVFNATYSWSPISGTNSFVVVSPGSYQSTTTTFTCDVSIPGCATHGYPTGDLTKLSLPTFSTSTTSVSCSPGCNGTATVASPTGGGGGPYTYNWSNGGSTSTLSSLCQGSYNVTVAGANGCPTTPVAVSVSPSGFTCNEDLNICSGESSSDYDGIYQIGNSFGIHQDFTIDNYFTIDNSDVIIDASKKIIIAPGATLRIQNGSHLHACGSTNMWQGIVLTDASSSLIIDGASTIIEDATLAIEAALGGSVLIEDATLRRNANTITINQLPSNLVIRGATLSCNSALNSGGFTNTHINLTDAGSVEIGEPGFNPNYIEDALIGVTSLRTNLRVVNSVFNGNTAPTGSIGISHTGNTSNIYDLKVGIFAGAASPVSISNYEKGIYGLLNRDSIRYNDIQYCTDGIEIDNVHNRRSAISNNDFTGCSNSSITCYDISTSGSNYFAIIDNEINQGTYSAADFGTVGIVIWNQGLQSGGMLINSNDIDNVKIGIDLLNMNGVLCSNNSINFPMPAINITTSHYGIHSNNSGGYCRFLENNISFGTAPGTGLSDNLNGIGINSNSSLNLIKKNQFENMGTGIDVTNSSLSQFMCNKFITNYRSMMYRSSAYVGDQGATDEPWDNEFSYDDANGSPFKFARNTPPMPSTWYYRDLQGSGNIYSPDPDDQLVIHDDDESGEDLCDLAFPSRTTTAGNLQAAMRSINHFTTSADQNSYRLLNSIYRTLADDSLLMYQEQESDEVLKAFYDTYKNSNLGKFYSVAILTDSIPSVAAELNSTITPSNVMEANSKLVNDIYFDATEATGAVTLTEAQLEILDSISLLHPVIGGEAVFRARAMLKERIQDTSYTCALADTPQINLPAYTMGMCGQIGIDYDITPVTGATKYEWTVSDTAIASIDSLDYLSGVGISFSSSFDSVLIFVKAWNNCGRSPADTLIVYAAPDVPGGIDGATSVCPEDVEYYSTSGSSGATSYSWSYPSGTTVLGGSSGSSILLLWGESGGDITVRAVNDCSMSAAETLAVSNSCRKGSEQQITDIVAFTELKLFPNPATGLLTAVYSSPGEGSRRILISDEAGRILFANDKTVVKGLNRTEIDLTGFAKGIYLFTLRLNERIHQANIIVQ